MKRINNCPHRDPQRDRRWCRLCDFSIFYHLCMDFEFPFPPLVFIHITITILLGVSIFLPTSTIPWHVRDCLNQNPIARVALWIPSLCVWLVRGPWYLDIPQPAALGSGSCGGRPLSGPIGNNLSGTKKSLPSQKIFYVLQKSNRWLDAWSGPSKGNLL
jgi:hypothetical protein